VAAPDLTPRGGGWLNFGSVRGLTATPGWKVQTKFFSPSVGVTSTSSTERLVWTNARSVRVPAAVVMVPRSSEFHRSSRQSIAVIWPTGSRVRYPIGSRASPNSEPNSGRWSCTWLCCTLNRMAFRPGSA
jgi:hypothetical protein